MPDIDNAPIVQKNPLPLWLCLLSALGFILYVFNYENAFPGTSMQFKIPRHEIQIQNKNLAQSIGFKQHTKFETTVFQVNNSVLLYLQHNFGPKEADSLIKKQIPCFYWQTRLCSPSQLEEFRANRTPDGKLCSLTRTIANDQPLPDISQGEGSKIIEEFLSKETDLKLNDYKLLSFQKEKRTAHNDLAYTFQSKHPDLKGSELRLIFTLSGNLITNFESYLHTPDSWHLKFRGMQSYNKILNTISHIFFFIVFAGSVIYFAQLILSRKARWSLAIRASILVAICSSLSTLVNLPVYLHYYSTNNQEFVFYLSIVLQLLAKIFIEAVVYLPIFVCGETVYRKLSNQTFDINKILNKQGIQEKGYANKILAGIAICGIWQGWQNLYFWLGSFIGVSNPLGTNRPEVYGSYIPCFDLMFIGSSASFQEEIVYRIISLLVLQKLCRNFWLANFLQAFLWSLGHTTYPASPVWARVVELTVAGFMGGIFFKNFGLLPMLVAHYLFDAFNPELFRAHDWQLFLSGFFAITPPFILFVLSKKWSSKEISEIENSSLDSVPPESQEKLIETTTKVQPLSVRYQKQLIIFGLILFGFGQLILFTINPAKLSLQTTREEAVAIAENYLKENNLKDPRLNLTFSRLNSEVDNSICQCLQDKLGKNRFHKIFDHYFAPLTWLVRYSSEDQIKEMSVGVDACRKRLSFFNLTLADKDKGATLSEKDAIAKIEKFLQTYHQDLFPLKLVGRKIIERENRRDITTQWESTLAGTSDTKLMIGCSVIGDTVSDFYRSWEIPDKWNWKYQEFTSRRAIGYSLFFALLSMICALTLFWLLRVPHTGNFHFLWAVKYVSIAGVLYVTCAAQKADYLISYYSTGTPFTLAYIQEILDQLPTCIFALTLLGALISLTPDTYKQFRLENNQISSISTGYCLAFIFMILACVYSYFVDSLSNQVSLEQFDFITFYAHANNPALLAICFTLFNTLYAVPTLELTRKLFDCFVCKPAHQTALFAFTSLVFALMVRQSHDCILIFALSYISLHISWFCLNRIFRFDAIALAACIYAGSLSLITLQMLYLARSIMYYDALICTIALILPFVAFQIRQKYFA